MKFLILTQYFLPEVGASQQRLAAIARELTRSGHQVEVLTAMPHYPHGKIFPRYRGHVQLNELWEGIPVHRTWLYAAKGAGVQRMLNYGSFTAMSLVGAVNVSRPDWLFVESPPPTLAVSGLIIARWLRASLILNVADMWPDSIRELHLVENKGFLHWAERLELFLYRNAEFLSAATQGIRTRLIENKNVPARKITFLPNGVDVETYTPMPADESLRTALGLHGKAVILYAGTHGYAHGLEHVLEAASRLRNEPIHFLFIGDGSEKQRLIELAARSRLDNVSFHDPVSASEIRRYLSIALCGLVPQRNVPLFAGNRPAKMFTIMAMGKPVLFAGKGEGANLIARANAGITVSPEDSLAMANAVTTLANDRSLSVRMGESGRRYVESNFTWPAIVRGWLEELGRYVKAA